jgi:GT2 family glycosyltransferase
MSPLPRSTCVSIVMTARERHALTLRAIESVLAETAPPFRFIYLDVQSPPALRAELQALAASGRIELRSFDQPMWPQAARQSVLAELDGDFVVFMDNDVVVSPGWLEALLRCARETGAGIVGPLYLWGDGRARPRIHMAGGRLVETREAAGRVLDESHVLFNADPEQEAASLQRRPCDFVEFHCMLVRRELLADGIFDPRIRCVHEHVDVALTARERGASIWFEPAAQVTYLAFAPFTLDDLQLLRARWDASEGEASIAAFARKWQVIDDGRSFWGVRTFLKNHVATSDPIRPALRARPEQDLPMQRAELAQTRSDLLDLAQAHGYAGGDLRTLSDACERASLVMNAGYRPCGRPFLNHLIGTASVLVRYGFRIDLVAAGLLHAAYTHCPPFQAGPAAAIAQVEALLGGRGSQVERLVRDYTLRETRLATLAADPPGATLVGDAELLMLVAANEIEMYLSGEIRYSGRADTLSAECLNQVSALAQHLGVAGLAATLVQLRADERPVSAELQTRTTVSYRIAGGAQPAVNMVSELPRLLAERARIERATP